MKELDRCIEFLKLNGYAEEDANEEFLTMCKESEELFAIDLNESEIVLVDGDGDWLHLPCNYYALIGALIYFSQIGVGYPRLK